MMEPARTAPGVAQVLRIVLFLILLGLGVWLLYTIRDTLLPFGIAFFLSYILAPLVDRLESRGMNRIVGVLVIYACGIGLLVLLMFQFVPVLMSGLQDIRQRVSGDIGEWACEIRNTGATGVVLNQVASQTDEFSVVDSVLPMELAPGASDTLHFEFLPLSGEPTGSAVTLTVQAEGGVSTIRFHLTGNGRVPTANRSAVLGTLAVSDTVHHFGTASPGYVSIVRGQIAALEPQLKAALPMLEGVDLSRMIGEQLRSFGTDLLNKTPALVGSLISGITLLVIVPIVGLFFLGEGLAIKRGFIEMVPNRHFEMVLNLLHRVDIQLGGYIRGLVLSVTLISLLSITGLRLIGLHDYLVVGTIAGLANVIPYLGPAIGIVAGVVAAVMQESSIQVGVWLPVVGVFACIQIIDNVFVAPVVVARSVNLHPLVVIFVVLVGNQLFGAVGMLLAVPVTAVVKVSVQTLYEGLRSYSVS